LPGEVEEELDPGLRKRFTRVEALGGRGESGSCMRMLLLKGASSNAENGVGEIDTLFYSSVD
jgi:hypothetical protein